ncbi:hypothetical protein WJ0W_002188 [Paenibacillus melissococcoides]|uniref:Uncharacterized protein n=1 Tax=Paenibacillus melissococcoides TaxID=2912268 RepID=A0ABN8U2G0_9BACL|nr:MULTISPECIES: kelch repeat-containing protein [Paenibacillus]MEB9894033.1 kelch repeat-containing protein [Bacillus cereus]CAH8244958.1 hypothetical protein WJ0W_002188 [Paenibacillus melissococcoides]CAH8709483.1 hypothetical protein WDD9_002270 [Paenibacillus melissococcoides]CAH8710210.1 hypothetical protein HTL2_002557 [Paenibacillus melissococcoides]GIO82186.1 hypothetical protein J6TS7_57960 [Paenibacillus dendritiformis]
MKKRVSLVFAVLLLIGVLFSPVQTFASEESGKWVRKSDLPEPRAGAATATVNGYIYVFGGSSGGKEAYSGTKHNTTYMYDPTTDTWTEKKNMPTARAGLTTAVVNNKIYVIGGYLDKNGKVERTNIVEVYDTQTDEWSTVANMPTARSWAPATAIGDKIYVFGGGNSNGALKNTECYDTSTDTWTRKTDMPLPANGIASVEIGGKIYVFGGWDFSSTHGSILEYDPETDSWLKKNESTMPRNGMGVSVVNDKAYILGGSSNGANGILSSVEIYDPKTNTLTNFDNLTFPRTQNLSSAINNNIYVIGGTTGKEDGILSTVEMYTIESPDPEEPQQPEEPEQPKGDRAILVVTMTTGLEREFDLSMDEVNAFIVWYDAKDAGSGPSKYAIDKHNNNKGPFSKRTDYVIFNNILTFEVNEYSIK